MASGDLLHQWQAGEGNPPSTNFAPIIQRGAAGHEHLFAAFDAGTDESLDFSGVFNRAYDGGGVTVVIIWASEDQTTGNVRWDASFERHQDDAFDLDASGLAAVQSATGTTASASGELQYTEITFTDGAQMDSLAVGESFRFRVTRDANNAADTMTNDAQLKAVEIRET